MRDSKKTDEIKVINILLTQILVNKLHNFYV